MAFVSPEGAALLAQLRVGHAPLPCGKPAAVLLASVPSDECGCPEEIWRVDGLECLIHFEADGRSEMFCFVGEAEIEFTFDGIACINELRAAMFHQIARIGVEE